MRDTHRATIGAAIARLREEQGWSQRELARWVGLDQSAVSRVEAGRRRLKAEELERFADAFGVSADELLSARSGAAGDAADLEDLASLASPGLRSPAGFGPADRARRHRARSRPQAPRPRDAEAAPGPASLSLRPAPPDAVIEGADDIGPPRDMLMPEECLAPEGFAQTEECLVPGGAERPDDFEPPDHLERPADASIPPGAAFPDDVWALDDEAPIAGAGPFAPAPLSRQTRRRRGTTRRPPAGGELPAAVTGVVRDWLELRRLGGGEREVLAWSKGHSAEGREARLLHPLHSTDRGPLRGDVLYDRVARFWRSELHIDPDDGPVPDLVPLLEDALGVQVIVARVADPRTGDPHGRLASSEHPSCAAVTVDDVPFIFVNAARPVVLQRFALAHAFAHTVLGHGDVVDHRIEWNRNNPPEAAANDFAEEFLLPVRAARRWYERRGDPAPGLDTLLALANTFGISAWSALYRSRAAGRVHPKQFAGLRREMHAAEWQLLPRQAFLGGLRDTLTFLTVRESLPQGHYGPPAVLRYPTRMRVWALTALERGSLTLGRAAELLHVQPHELGDQLRELGLQ